MLTRSSHGSVLSYGQKFTFHAVGFDRKFVSKGVERQKGFLDLTEHLKFKFIPLPDRLNPVSPLCLMGGFVSSGRSHLSLAA